jgi:hypothetical protein
MISTETSKDIIVNGTKVTCYSDGSVNVHSPRSKGRKYGYDHPNGYRYIKWGKKNYQVHSLIAKAFLGDRPDGLDVDHIDGKKDNNHPSNLRYVTRSQNLRSHRRNFGASKYRGVQLEKKKRGVKYRVVIDLGRGDKRKRHQLGLFDDEKEAAIARDTFCFNELNYPLEGLNFPDLFVDKSNTIHQPETVKDKEENIERVQTQIEMIRQESRILSYRIDRMMEQRKNLSEEKRGLKLILETLSV